MKNIKAGLADSMAALESLGTGRAVAAAALAAVAPIPALAGPFDSMLSNVAGMAIVLVAIVSIVVILKMVADRTANGGASITEILTKVGIALLIVGFIVVLSNITGLSSVFGGVAQSGTDLAANVATEALG